VDGIDFYRLINAYGSRSGDIRFVPEADFNRDGIIDRQDLDMFRVAFGFSPIQ
jgi:hypothetical protein